MLWQLTNSQSNGNVSSRYTPRTTGRNDKRKPATLDSSDLSDPDSETYEDDQEGEDELDSADEDPEDSDFSEEPSRKKRRKGQGKGKGKKAVEVDEETAEEILGKHRGVRPSFPLSAFPAYAQATFGPGLPRNCSASARKWTRGRMKLL